MPSFLKGFLGVAVFAAACQFLFSAPDTSLNALDQAGLQIGGCAQVRGYRTQGWIKSTEGTSVEFAFNDGKSATTIKKSVAELEKCKN